MFGLLKIIEVEDKKNVGMVVEVVLIEKVIFSGLFVCILDECGKVMILFDFVGCLVDWCD